MSNRCDDGCGERDESTTFYIRIAFGAIALVAVLLSEYVVSLDERIVICISLVAYVALAYDVAYEAFKAFVKEHILNEDMLMVIATVGAFAIGFYTEALAAMLLFKIGEVIEGRAGNRSEDSIKHLMDLQSDRATVVRDGVLVETDTSDVAVGEIVVVKPGEKIPLDGTVISGRSSLDTRALTGESVPRDVREGDAVMSGCININGALRISVTKICSESTAAKVLGLIEGAASKKADSERFITTFAKYYTPSVVLLALLVAILPPLLLSGDWSTWIYRALIFLVVSCPCAFVISIPLAFRCGIGGASRAGILIKGSNHIESLAKADTVVMDKTGTLTKGTFSVTEIRPVSMEADELILIAAKAESFSDHPISQSIRDACRVEGDVSSVDDAVEIAGMGVRAVVDGRTVHVGNGRLMCSLNEEFVEEEVFGTIVYVAVDGEYAGSIIFSDEEKEDARTAVASLREVGVRRTAMLTGDSDAVGRKVADALGIDDVYTEMLPADKVGKVEELMGSMPEGGRLVYVGDGINDAPVLARSDVGIAMGGLGSDAAIEAADVVIVNDQPSKVAESIRISKRTMGIVMQNTVFSIGFKVGVLILTTMGHVSMWMGVIADVGVMSVAVLNSTRALRLTDRSSERK